MEANFLTHLRMLARLAITDQKFAEKERNLIYSIGKANAIKEEEINRIVEDEITTIDKNPIKFNALSNDEKFEFLYDIIQLMKIDNEVFLSEIRFCEEMAVKLGYDKKVVKKMSARIYADPAITADRTVLKREAAKYFKS